MESDDTSPDAGTSIKHKADESEDSDDSDDFEVNGDTFKAFMKFMKMSKIASKNKVCLSGSALFKDLRTE